jgi:hypothetical protein
MLSVKARAILKDVLLVGAVFAVISGAYFGLAVAERYRALTQAYIAQSQQLIQILERENGKAQASAGEPGS